MHYARDSMLKNFNAPQNKYIVLPTGRGSTGAIQKVFHLLKIREETDLDWKKPIVFITPYQNHSNLLPWVQFYEKVQLLAHNQQGTLDMDKIQIQLMNFQQKSMIVSASAASNVTSKITHLKELNQVIKKQDKRKKKTLYLQSIALHFVAIMILICQYMMRLVLNFQALIKTQVELRVVVYWLRENNQ